MALNDLASVTSAIEAKKKRGAGVPTSEAMVNDIKNLQGGFGAEEAMPGVSAINAMLSNAAPDEEKGVTAPETKTTSPAEQTKVAPTVEHPLSKKYNGDIYAALRDEKFLSNEQFKDFVDKHGNNVPGLGYIQDPKTGKVIARVAEKPEDQEVPMNVTQAHAAAALMTAKAHGVGAQAYKEEQIRTKDEALQQKKDVDWENRWAPKITDPMTGQVSQDLQTGVVRAMMAGDEIPQSKKGIETNIKQGTAAYTKKFLQDKKNKEKMDKLGISVDDPNFQKMMLQGFAGGAK